MEVAEIFKNCSDPSDDYPRLLHPKTVFLNVFPLALTFLPLLLCNPSFISIPSLSPFFSPFLLSFHLYTPVRRASRRSCWEFQEPFSDRSDSFTLLHLKTVLLNVSPFTLTFLPLLLSYPSHSPYLLLSPHLSPFLSLFPFFSPFISPFPSFINPDLKRNSPSIRLLQKPLVEVYSCWDFPGPVL